LLGRLFLAFTLIPLVEFYLLVKVGEHIGLVWTVLVVLFTGWLGALLARREGLRVFIQFQKEIQSGKLPGDTILEGVLVLASGILLITPGFLTDITGLTLLIPPARQWFARWLKERYRRKLRMDRGIIDVEVIDEEPRA